MLSSMSVYVGGGRLKSDVTLREPKAQTCRTVAAPAKQRGDPRRKDITEKSKKQIITKRDDACISCAR